MTSYVTYSEFISAYGDNFLPGESVFATSGAVVEFLEYISSLIDLYAGRTFSTGVLTEQFTARPGANKVYSRTFPLNSITSIEYYIPGTVSSPVSLSASDYMFFSDGKIMFANKLYGNALYVMTYNAGYTETPAPIKQATLMLANTYATALDNSSVAIPEGGSTTRFVFDKYEENYVDPRQRYDDMNIGIPVTIHAILNRYKFFK